ncbi:MAG TPA: helix-turn-helix domain-containing protein [Actinomycetes bacterium]|jgi:sugar-specific transcriptional regulator TrmB|nr:helix-turn-helix domain-containing protein [Actinomycetes bacterium]
MSSVPVEADLIDRLVRHGLGQGEARCYVGMLAPRAFKVSEIARKAGLPRSRAYELIRSLVRAGLCSEVAGGGVARFRAAPPNEAIGRLEAFLGEQERRRSAALSSILEGLDSRDTGSLAGSHDDPVAILSRREQVIQAYERLIRETREEMVTVLPMPWSPVHRPSPMDSLAAGARIRAVFDRAACASEPHREFVRFYCAQGVEARVVDEVEVQFAVFDRRRTILHLTVPDAGTHRLESLLVSHAGFGEGLQQAFECLWDQGIPFDRAVGQVAGPVLAGARRRPRGVRQLVPRGGEGRFIGDE